MADPLTKVYDRLQVLLAQWPPLTQIVKPGSFKNFDTPNTRAIQPNVQAADLPEAKLMEARFAFDAYADSLNTKWQCDYPLQLASGSVHLSTANLVMMESCRAITNAGRDLGMQNLVQKWIIQGNADFSLFRADANRGKLEWSTMLNIRVMFSMSRSELLTQTF